MTDVAITGESQANVMTDVTVGGDDSYQAEVLELRPCTDIKSVVRGGVAARHQPAQVGGWVRVASRVLGGIAAAGVALLALDIWAVVSSDQIRGRESPDMGVGQVREDGMPESSQLFAELTGRDIFNPPIYDKQAVQVTQTQAQRTQEVVVPDWQNDARKLNLVGVSVVGESVNEAIVVGEKGKMYFLRVGDKLILAAGGQEIEVANIRPDSITFRVGTDSLTVQ